MTTFKTLTADVLQFGCALQQFDEDTHIPVMTEEPVDPKPWTQQFEELKVKFQALLARMEQAAHEGNDVFFCSTRLGRCQEDIDSLEEVLAGRVEIATLTLEEHERYTLVRNNVLTLLYERGQQSAKKQLAKGIDTVIFVEGKPPHRIVHEFYDYYKRLQDPFAPLLSAIEGSPYIQDLKDRATRLNHIIQGLPDEKAIETLYKSVWEEAGRPEGDPQYGEHHIGDDPGALYLTAKSLADASISAEERRMEDLARKVLNLGCKIQEFTEEIRHAEVTTTKTSFEEWSEKLEELEWEFPRVGARDTLQALLSTNGIVKKSMARYDAELSLLRKDLLARQPILTSHYEIGKLYQELHSRYDLLIANPSEEMRKKFVNGLSAILGDSTIPHEDCRRLKNLLDDSTNPVAYVLDALNVMSDKERRSPKLHAALKSLPPEVSSIVYEAVWKAAGSPSGDPQFGEHHATEYPDTVRDSLEKIKKG